MYNQERILIQPSVLKASGHNLCPRLAQQMSSHKTPTLLTFCMFMYVENIFYFQMATDQDQGFKVREIEFCGKGRPGSFPIIHY